MGRLVRVENPVTIGKAFNADRAVEAKPIESFPLEPVDELRKAVRKLKWIGMQAEAQTIERLLFHARRDERTLPWPWETD